MNGIVINNNDTCKFEIVVSIELFAIRCIECNVIVSALFPKHLHAVKTSHASSGQEIQPRSRVVCKLQQVMSKLADRARKRNRLLFIRRQLIFMAFPNFIIAHISNNWLH